MGWCFIAAGGNPRVLVSSSIPLTVAVRAAHPRAMALDLTDKTGVIFTKR